MIAIIRELMIAAPPEKVYKALTEREGIAGWWTEDVSIQPEVGSLAEFRFREGKVQVKIAELDLNKKVYWISRQGLGFEGTTITWQLTPVANGTSLLFTQDGLVHVDELFEQKSAVWDYFFKSLVAYIETEKGTPGFPENFFG